MLYPFIFKSLTMTLPGEILKHIFLVKTDIKILYNYEDKVFETHFYIYLKCYFVSLEM